MLQWFFFYQTGCYYTFNSNFFFFFFAKMCQFLLRGRRKPDKSNSDIFAPPSLRLHSEQKWKNHAMPRCLTVASQNTISTKVAARNSKLILVSAFAFMWNSCLYSCGEPREPQLCCQSLRDLPLEINMQQTNVERERERERETDRGTEREINAAVLLMYS